MSGQVSSRHPRYPGFQVSRWRSRFLGRSPGIDPGRIPGFQVPFGFQVSPSSIQLSASSLPNIDYICLVHTKLTFYVWQVYKGKLYFSILVCNYFLSSQIIEEEKAVSFTVLFILSKFNEMRPKTKLLRPTKTVKLSD